MSERVLFGELGRPAKLKVVARMSAIALIVGLGACASDVDVEYNYPHTNTPGGLPSYKTTESVLGPSGGSLFSSGDGEQETGGGSGIAVNTFLWRASLDTVSFMPLASADPFGGVIITDWYEPPESRGERFKVNIFILDRALRSDGVRATVFKQMRTAASTWKDAASNEALDRQLEDAILTRARQLRITTNQGKSK